MVIFKSIVRKLKISFASSMLNSILLFFKNLDNLSMVMLLISTSPYQYFFNKSIGQLF
jgi:hypothetical protein